MSDQRPEWMPSEDEISAATYADQKEHESGQPNTESLIYRTGIRAQIEVLEEMLSRLGGYSNSTKGYCEAKIAALRKELE